MILKRIQNVNHSCGELGTMRRAGRIPITELNQHLTCTLCKGYFIDATTIIECLHTFCKSCIVKYLETNKYCPVCDVQVHKTKPLLNIRPDKTLQDIVYKLVPRLFQNEMQRRHEYYAAHLDAKPSCMEQKREAAYQHLLSPDETICLTLNYHGSSRTARYLRCQAAVSVTHLQKLIRAKYDLTDHHRVDVLYNQDCLNSYLTLMDIAYIYLWKRKEPLELTYRIYEKTAKRLKLEADNKETNASNSDWKEVQLRISENGEMSVTGIQDSIDIINEHPLLEQEEAVPAVDSSLCENESCAAIESSNTNPAVELPDLSKGNNYVQCSESATIVTIASAATSSVANTTTLSTSTVSLSAPTHTTSSVATNQSQELDLSGINPEFPVVSLTTTTAKIESATKVSSEAKNLSHPVITSTSSCGTKLTLKYKNVNSERAKHKLEESKSEGEPEEKQPKQTILNHSLGLQNLSNNHPLKKHAQKNRVPEATKPSVAPVSSTTATNTVSTVSTVNSNTFPKLATLINKNFNNIQQSRPGTPQKWSPTPGSPPCYVPKPAYNPVINVPSIQPSTSVSVKATEQISNSSKLTIKSKPSTPIGYKTLRDPPKTWNPQISRPNIHKVPPDPKYTDVKNIRPAKFFKMRNNMPRYLGNPASGVKPMYQVHVSPEKDKQEPISKSEIKKHSIVKIDPKTLKPISERAPDTSNLCNQTDLKINTSSVSIFNPLKLQSSPKGDRKSPKSPHSPKKSSSPSSKRDKLNLSFTPANPFVPNLASPNVNPTQFLYPSGPPGFPPYDPRVMAAYHTLFYGQRMPFPPSPLPGLSLDLNQRKSFEMHPPTSPQLGNLPHQQQSPKSKPATQSSAKPHTNSSRKTKEGGKNEKSLQNAVEKLTQNRFKENAKNEVIAQKKPDEAPKPCDKKDVVEAKSDSSKTEKNKENSDNKQTAKNGDDSKVYDKSPSNNNTDSVSLVVVDKK